MTLQFEPAVSAALCVAVRGAEPDPPPTLGAALFILPRLRAERAHLHCSPRHTTLFVLLYLTHRVNRSTVSLFGFVVIHAGEHVHHRRCVTVRARCTPHAVMSN